jgi:hypothetical protein
LRALESSETRFFAVRAVFSKTKAGNLNASLEHVETPLVAIMDADTIPTDGCLDELIRAQRITRADCVQGQLHVARSEAGWLSRLVFFEYRTKYLGVHVSRWRRWGTLYFCGSNALWRTRVLKDLRFDETALTEDIDISFRTLAARLRIAYADRAIALEAAPPTWSAWLAQRRRWTRGWVQVATQPGTLAKLAGMESGAGDRLDLLAGPKRARWPLVHVALVGGRSCGATEPKGACHSLGH